VLDFISNNLPVRYVVNYLANEDRRRQHGM
jgi:hypothetical protein